MNFFYWILSFIFVSSIYSQNKDIKEVKLDSILFSFPSSWEVYLKNSEKKQEIKGEKQKPIISLSDIEVCQEILLLPDKKADYSYSINNITQKELDKIYQLDNKNTAIIITLQKCPEIYIKNLGRKNILQNKISLVSSALYDEIKKNLVSKGILSDKKEIQRKKIHRKLEKENTKRENPFLKQNADLPDPENVQKFHEEWMKYQETEAEKEKKMSPDDLKIHKKNMESRKILFDSLKINKYESVHFANNQGWMMEFIIQLPQEKPSYRHVYLNLWGNCLVTVLVFFSEAEPKKAMQILLSTLQERK